MAPLLAVKVTPFVPAFKAALTAILPVVLVTDTVFTLLLIAFKVRVLALSVKLITPLVLLLAPKVDTVLVLPKVVPPTELVVRVPVVLMIPVPASLIVPLLPVRLIMPLVLVTLALLMTMFWPAVKVIVPVAVVTAALTLILPLPVFSESVKALLPVVVKPTTLPLSSVKEATVKLSLAASKIEIAPPILLEAMELKLLALLFKVTALASRSINEALSVAKLIAPPCVIVPAVSKVNTPL